MNDSRPLSSPGAMLITLVVPPILVSIYLVLDRTQFKFNSGIADYVALAVSIVSGVAGILLSPLSRSVKPITAILYSFAAAFFLFFYMLWFVGVFFGDWL